MTSAMKEPKREVARSRDRRSRTVGLCSASIPGRRPARDQAGRAADDEAVVEVLQQAGHQDDQEVSDEKSLETPRVSRSTVVVAPMSRAKVQRTARGLQTAEAPELEERGGARPVGGQQQPGPPKAGGRVGGVEGLEQEDDEEDTAEGQQVR